MRRSWAGSVFRTTGAPGYCAKWKQHGTEQWRVSKGFETKAEAQDFLKEKREDYRKRRSGDFDPFEEHRRRPIAEHVVDFGAHLHARRRHRTRTGDSKHKAQSVARLTAAFAWAKVATLADLSLSSAERYLAHLEQDGNAAKTCNDHSAVLKQFGKWLEADNRIERSPFRMLQLLRGVVPEKKRQALTWQQVRDVAAAAPQRALQNAPRAQQAHYVALAQRRALVVLVAFLTGLRHNELAHLAWSWIDFFAGWLDVPAEIGKSARAEGVPLHVGLADVLQQERRRRGLALGPVAGSDLVLGELVNGTPKLPRHVVDRLRDDADWAGIKSPDEAGRILDLHSMRKSLSMALEAAGHGEGMRGDLLRHRGATVAERHYTERLRQNLAAAINCIPAEAAHVAGLWEPREEPDSSASAAPGCSPLRNTTAS